MPAVGSAGTLDVLRRKFGAHKPDLAAALEWWTEGTGQKPDGWIVEELTGALHVWDKTSRPPAPTEAIRAEATSIAAALGYATETAELIATEVQQARLRAVVAEGARRWAREHGPGATAPARALQFMTTDTWDDIDYPTTQERVVGLLPAVGMGLIAAREKVGKSLWAMQASIAIAAGKPFLGRATAPCATLYIEEEGSGWNLRDRRRRQAEALEVPGCPRAHWLLRQQFRLDDEADVAALSAYVGHHEIKVVFIGPLAQVASLTDENAVAEMTKITRTLTQLATEHEALFVLLHHRRKDGKDGAPTKIDDFFQTVRGSSALVGAVDVAIGLDRKPDEEHGKMFVLQRDGASFIEYYAFSTVSLCITPEEKPDTTKAPADRVLQLITDNPGITVKALASFLSPVTTPTIRTRLATLVADAKIIADTTHRGGAQYFPMTGAATVFGATAAPSLALS
jgi:hypothetical protein